MGTQKLDYGLSKFATYENYLDSMVHNDEYLYIAHVKSARKLAVLKSGVGKVYTSDEFYKIKFQISEELNPKVLSKPLYANHFHGDDEVLQALASREQLNITKRLAVRGSYTIHIPYISYHITVCRLSYFCSFVSPMDSISLAMSTLSRACRIAPLRYPAIVTGQPFFKVGNC